MNLSQSSTLTQASRQWATRPDDQRFTSLTELDAFCASVRSRSVGKTVASRDLEAVPVEGDNKALQVIGPNGGPVNVSHWAFGQLAQRAGAPGGYLRELPAPLAADCINYGLRFDRDVESLGVLLHKPEDEAATLRAVTGPNYGRVWNSTITRALLERFGDGVTGDFRVPGIFGKALTSVTKENTTLFASDRDMFVFLADEERRIEMRDRRDGMPGSLARGFFVWNSEVGSTSFGVAMFLFDYVCANRIVWGAQQYHEVRLRHSAGAPHRWVEEVAPMIDAYAKSSDAPVREAIALAQTKRIDDIDAFLMRRFNKAQTEAIKGAHIIEEHRPIESLWDAATAITAYAKGVPHQDRRVQIEREAGRVLDLAAA